MNILVKKIILGTLMAIILVVVTVANVAAYKFRDVITTALGGFGIDTSSVDFNKTSKVCEDIEAEGIVLLKNKDNSLPLTNTKKLNIFGWSSIDMAYSGGGSGSSESLNKAVNLYDGLTEAGFECNPKIHKMYSDFKESRDDTNYWSQSYPYLNLIEPDSTYIKNNLNMEEVKEFSDTALVVFTRLGGEHQDLPKTQIKWKGEEDNTRTYLDITTEEESLLQLIKEQNFKNVVVLINSINTMNIGFIDKDFITAALNIGAVGEYGNRAVAKVLSGEVNPSGKLADTYAYDLSTAATYVNSPDGQNINSEFGGVKRYANEKNSYYIDYEESIYVGYKWYETADKEGFWNSGFAKEKWGIINGYKDVVQYPFGYGLSYTTFDWIVSNVTPSRNSTITEDSIIKIELNVTNTGSVSGSDVVELYYEAPYTKGEIEKSSKNLVAFAKTIVLEPGETQIVELEVKATDMSSYDYNDANNNDFCGYELEKGKYNLYLSTDSHNLKNENSTLTFEVNSDIKLKKIDGRNVSNHFTGDDALDAGISSDGSNTDANITYLSRGEFTNTFPKTKSTQRNKTFEILENWNTYVDTDEEYEYGVDSGLSLTEEDELNLELIKELGSDYDSDKWDLLISQMSITDLKKLILLGGYNTQEINSIGKTKLIDLDGPQGFNDSVMNKLGKSPNFTFFPSETVLAQTWSEKMAYTYGLAIGYEGSSSGVSGWYAPACDIHRSPFGGRNFEYYSEDPLLSGKMAANTIKGATNNGIYCYLKHFAVNETANIGKGASVGLNTWVTEQAMREVYLKSFEIAVKEGKANAMMAAYNNIGGIWCGASYALNTEVLRNEWGFEGSVITDAWTPTNNTYDMNYGLKAGTDLLLNSANTDLAYNNVSIDDSTSLACARKSAKNILYTLCNTIYRQTEYQAAKDRGENVDGEMFAVQVSNKAASKVKNTWVYGVVALDVVSLLGVGTWAYFVFFRKKKILK